MSPERPLAEPRPRGAAFAALAHHPATPGAAVRSLAAYVDRDVYGLLAVSFRLAGDLSRLRIPEPQPPGCADALWEHTCFEAFVAVAESAAYHEFNFAPSGQWAIYAFSAYRESEPLVDEALAPRIAVRRAADQLTLDAVVRLDRLSSLHQHAPLRIGLSAVIEDATGTCSYWALHHPSGKADFHHQDNFALRLPPPETTAPPEPD